MHSEEYWKRMRLGIALKIPFEKTNEVLGFTRNVVCKKLRNRARCKRKLYDSASNLTADSFVFLLQNEEFQMTGWDVHLKEPGDLEKGWNFKIQGYHLYFRNGIR